MLDRTARIDISDLKISRHFKPVLQKTAQDTVDRRPNVFIRDTSNNLTCRDAIRNLAQRLENPGAR